MGAELFLGALLVAGVFVAVVAVRALRGATAASEERRKRDRLDTPA
jgi:hypothetical protein